MQMSAYGGRLFMVKAIFRASLEPGELEAPSIFSRRALARANPTQNQWDSTDRPVGVPGAARKIQRSRTRAAVSSEA
jgi:hypothetical protein